MASFSANGRDATVRFWEACAMWRFYGTLFLWSCFAAFGAGPQAGVVNSVRGDAFIIRRNCEQACTDGRRVAEGEISRIIMAYGTRLGLGRRTGLAVKRFLFEPAESNPILALEGMQGNADYVSGKIGRFSLKAVETQTPDGMIGARGTTLAAAMDGSRP